MIREFDSLIKRLNKRYFFDYFVVFLIAFSLFAWLNSSATLPEPDSFYHAKISIFLSKGIVLDSLPWLQQTDLATNFVDHHFLYHLLLVPFITLFNPLVGVKLATVIFSSLLIITVYWLFKKFEIKYSFYFALALMAIYPWLFRMSIVKASAVFLILLFLAFYYLAHQKWLSLFIASFLSVWLYGGWPLLLALVIIYTFFNWLLERIRQEDSIWYKIKYVLSFKGKTFSWKGLIIAASGLLTGLILNPYFPQNLNFYWQQIVKIALVNYQYLIGVGGEWYPYDFIKLVTDAPLAMALLLIGVLVATLTYRKLSIYSWTWGSLTLIFLLMTLKSMRYIDFFVPFVVIFAAFCLSDYLKKLSRLHLKIMFNFALQGVFIILSFVLLAGFILNVPKDMIKAKAGMDKGFALDYFKEAALWLKDNTAKGEIVFHADWDDFPFLFYYNSHNLYLTGLDPTFMYEHNQPKYWEYVKITKGEQKQKLKEVIKESFGASYVFVDRDHYQFDRLLKNSVDFMRVYQDNEASIYQVID